MADLENLCNLLVATLTNETFARGVLTGNSYDGSWGIRLMQAGGSKLKYRDEPVNDTVAHRCGDELLFQRSGQLAQQIFDELDFDTSDGMVKHDIINGEDWYLGIAAVPEGATPHFHENGEERYWFLDGSAKIYETKKDTDPREEEWDVKRPIRVTAGDTYDGHKGVGHYVVNTGETPLLAAFLCRPSHIDPDLDFYRLDGPDLG